MNEYQFSLVKKIAVRIIEPVPVVETIKNVWGLITNPKETIIEGFSQLFFAIDNVVYKLAKISYQVYMNLARVRLGGDGALNVILKRIYIIIGFLMVFILAYNLLAYIIDPDKVSKKGGAGDLIKKIITALVVIVATPTLCNELYSIQNTILESNVIQKLLLSSEKVPVLQNEADSEDNYKSTYDLSANLMIANVYSTFVYPKSDEDDDAMVSTYDCYAALEEQYQENIEDDDSSDSEDEKDPASTYCSSYLGMIETGNISYMYELIEDGENYTYLFVISTIAGCLLVYFFLSFAVGLAGRAARLLVLELIAPIPALIDILPNQDGRLKTWSKELFSTFLEVFIFDFVIYGSIWMTTLIPKVASELLSSPKGYHGGFLAISFSITFLIFGILKVAKSLPKLICDVLGIKDTGLITNNLGSFFGIGAMMGGGLISATRGAFMGKGFGKVTGAVGGLFGGVARGTVQGLNVKNRKDMRSTIQNVYTGIEKNRASIAKTKRRYGLNEYSGDLAQRASTFFDNRVKMLQGKTEDYAASAADTLGIPGFSDYGRIREKIETAKRFDKIKDLKDAVIRFDKNARETDAQYKSFMANRSIESAQAYENHLKDEGIDTRNNNTIQEFKSKYLNEEQMSKAIDEIRNSVNNDNSIQDKDAAIASKILALRNQQEDLIDSYRKELETLGKDWSDQKLAEAADKWLTQTQEGIEWKRDYNKDLQDNITNSLLKDENGNISVRAIEGDRDLLATVKANSEFLSGNPKATNPSEVLGSLGRYLNEPEVINAKKREQAKQARKEEKNNK